MIAIIGRPGVGKSTLLNKLKARGFSTLQADIFFKDSYKAPNAGYEIIKKVLGPEFVNAKEVDLNVLREYVKRPKNLSKLESLVHPLLETHLASHKYDFVEIPIIGSKSAHFKGFFNKIIKLTDEKEKIEKKLGKRVVDKSHLDLISSLYKDFNDEFVVEISVNEAHEVDVFLKNIA